MTDARRNSASPGWIDTHCHLDFPVLHERLIEVFRRAHDAQIQGFIVPGTRGPVPLNGFSSRVRAAWGVHPLFADHRLSDDENLTTEGQEGQEVHRIHGKHRRGCGHDVAAFLQAEFAHCPYVPVAIGECGFDRDVSASCEVQRLVFITHLEIATAARLPVLLHLRGGWEEALSLLRRLAPQVPWVLHSFGGSLEIARQFWRFDNAFFSFSGSLCYPTARKTPEVARQVPLGRVLFETDAPDILPPGWPKAPNEPAALPLIAGRFAELRERSIAEVQAQVFQNTCTVFPYLEMNSQAD